MSRMIGIIFEKKELLLIPGGWGMIYPQHAADKKTREKFQTPVFPPSLSWGA